MALQFYGKLPPTSVLLYPKLVQELDRLRKGGIPQKTLVERSNIFAIIKKELNLNISVTFVGDGSESAMIPLPMLNKDHPYYQRYQNELMSHEGITKIQRGGGVVEGGFDKEGKAFGFFAEMETTVAIGSGLFSTKYTNEEIAAILCHEIGHYREALLALKYAFTANHMVSNAVNAYMNAGGRDERLQLVLDYEQAVGTVIVNKDALVDRKDRELVTTVIVGSMKENGCSELNTPNLDYSQCEQAADNFATACGAGDSLATALSKVHGYFNPDRVPRPIYYSLDLAGFIMKSTLFVTGGPIIQAGLLANLMLSNSPLARDYDKGGERIARIRRALIVESKSTRVNRVEAEHLSQQLDTIAKVEALYTDKTPIFEFLWVTITPWGRKDKKQSDLVKLYEKLVANELHAAALKLRSL